jgi:AraC-like DNA-binding protein
LRRAIEFIEANADKNIDLGDIAETVCLTPRAVQYMFRRHLDTTPLQYLRRIRLNRVHHELLTANRRHDTVSAIAARWGFMHAGRFASFYRQTYGRSPHITLRNGQPADKSSYGEDAEILVGKAFSEALMCLRNNSTHGCVGPNSVEQESRPPSRLERHSFRIPPPPLLTNLTMKVGRDAGMPHVGQHHWRSAGMA